MATGLGRREGPYPYIALHCACSAKPLMLRKRTLSLSYASESEDVQRSYETSEMQTLPALRSQEAFLQLCTQVSGLPGRSPVGKACHLKSAAKGP
jgi:hypothetical protein